MATATTMNRDWIRAEFSKGIDAEHSMSTTAKARSESPPDPALGVLYHEIASADERHVTIVETIATRYGHNPSRTAGGGLGETLGRIKDKVAEIGTEPWERLAADLTAKANAIHWYAAWIQTFEALGDTESARELAAVATEEKAHRDALQEGLNRMVLQHSQAESGAPDQAKA